MPVKEIWIDVFRPTARSGKVMRKKTYPNWQVHAARVLAFSEQCTLLIVESSRGSGGPRQRRKGDLGAYRIAPDCLFRIPAISSGGAVAMVDAGSLLCRWPR